MGIISGTMNMYVYKNYVLNTHSSGTGSGFGVGGTATNATPSTTVLIDETAHFITDGVMVDDEITMTVGGETAVVVSVDSETQITSTALSAAGEYEDGEDYTIVSPRNSGNVIRLCLYGNSTSIQVIRKLVGISDAASGSIRIYKGIKSGTVAPVFEIVFPQSLIFDFDPDIRVSRTGERIIIEVDFASEAASSLNVSWEWRASN